MTVVVGTAGHIDHGKTTLLRALTGIDADRLPEERQRGMTIDVGYAYLALADGSEIDFVDVPGHDRLIGNMLVGAGEIDAAMLIVAADDGPRAQTHEHLALLDALGIEHGLAVVTKADVAGEARTAEVVAEVGRLLGATALRDARVIVASGVTGDGIDELRGALVAVRDAVATQPVEPRPAALAVDRVFTVKGRGVVVTGTLRGGRLERGETMRVVPTDRPVRVREVQVHGRTVMSVEGGGRTALNLTGLDGDGLHRGMVLTTDPTVVACDRVLVELRGGTSGRTRARLHLGTAVSDAVVDPAGRDGIVLPTGRTVATVRLAPSLAARPGDRFVLRQGRQRAPVGGIVLDPDPVRGTGRRRRSSDRIAALAAAIERGDASAVDAARLDLHGICLSSGRPRLASDVLATAADAVLRAVIGTRPGVSLPAVRSVVARSIRGSVTVTWDDAITAAVTVVDGLVADGRLVRDGDRVRDPAAKRAGVDPVYAAAMDRVEASLDVAAPPSLSAAAGAAGCPDAGVRELERSGRIVRLGSDLAYASAMYARLTAQAVAMARLGPLTPAALRDATGTSRKYVTAILEDLDLRQVLRRTPAGHVPGPRAAAAVAPDG